MAEFTVKTDALKAAADTEERLRRELENIRQTVRGVSGSLVLKTASAAAIKKRLGSLAGKVESQRSSMGNLKNALERAVGLYESTEHNICGQTGKVKSAQIKAPQAGVSPWNVFMDWIKKAIGEVGAMVGGILSPVTTAWNKLVGSLTDWINSLGKGTMTDKPPTADWAGPVAVGTAGGVIAGSAVSSGVTAGNTAAGNASSSGNAASTAHLVNRDGQVIADINGENYCSNKNMSYAAGYHGECTWYAYGRFMEVTGIKLNTARHAKDWLADNAGDSRVKVTYGGADIQWPAIAVQKPEDSSSVDSTTGHVLFVEGVGYNADGTPAIVYYTEANVGGVDGALKSLPYQKFVDKGISGYITKA